MNPSINLRSITFLSVALVVLLGYNYLSAQVWTQAPANPPTSNTAAPINVGPTMQAKTGNLAANILAATTEMRSNRYCDALGQNCFSPNYLTTVRQCPVGQFVTGILADGSVACAPGSSNITCRSEASTFGGSCMSWGGSVSCPSGWAEISRGTLSCGGTSDRNTVTCIRTVCE